jgi:hypothetical protein
MKVRVAVSNEAPTVRKSLCVVPAASFGKWLIFQGAAGIRCWRTPARQKEARFREPEKMGSPSTELSKITGRAYQKVSSSREIGKHLDIDNTRSSGFKNLVFGVKRWERVLLAL